MEIKIFDIVKYEKKKAMERFTKLERIKKLVKVLEIVLVLILLYWSTMKVPLAVRFFSKLFELSVSFLNSHFFFLIGNAIILAVFLQNWAWNYSVEDSRRSEASPEVRTRVAQDNGKLEKKESALVPKLGKDSEEAHKPIQILSTSYPWPKGQKESQIVEMHKRVQILQSSYHSPKVQEESQIMETHKRVQNLSTSHPSPHVQEDSQIVETRKRVQILSSSSPPLKVQCEAVEVAIAEAEQEIRRFKRTLSAKLKREIAVRPKKEHRRSETERRVVIPSIKSVEHLTNQDFKLAIDAFIHKHKLFSKERITE